MDDLIKSLTNLHMVEKNVNPNTTWATKIREITQARAARKKSARDKSGYTRKRLKRGSRFDMKTRVNTLSDGTRLMTFVKEGVVTETVPLDAEGRKHGKLHIFDDKGIVTETQDWVHGRQKKLTVFTNYNNYIETKYEHDGATNITTVIDGVKDNTVYNNVMGKEIRTEYFGVPLRRTDSIRHYHRSKIYSDIRYMKPKISTVKR